MRKLAIILTLLLTCMGVNAQNISIHRSGASVRALMQSLQQEYGYSFSLSSDVVDIDRTVPSVDVDSGKIEDVLQIIFRGQEVKYVINGKTIVVTKDVTSVQSAKPGNQATEHPSGLAPKGGVQAGTSSGNTNQTSTSQTRSYPPPDYKRQGGR